MKMEKLKADYGNVLWTGKKCILGMPISFTRYILTDTTLYTKVGLLNIKEDEIQQLADNASKSGALPFGTLKKLNQNDVLEIYKLAY